MVKHLDNLTEPLGWTAPSPQTHSAWPQCWGGAEVPQSALQSYQQHNINNLEHKWDCLYKHMVGLSKALMVYLSQVSYSHKHANGKKESSPIKYRFITMVGYLLTTYR